MKPRALKPARTAVESRVGAVEQVGNSERCLDSVAVGFTFYYLTTLIVVAGVSFGVIFLERQSHRRAGGPVVVNAFASWDGAWYTDIVRDGYFYDPANRSSVAFFPAYPTAGYLVAKATGVREDIALLIVSHVCLFGVFALLAAYIRERFGDGSSRLVDWTLLVFGLWPISLFFRMAYSESLFLLIVILALYGMQRKWPVLALAVIVGLATCARPVGVALLAPFALHLWRRRRSWTGFAVQGSVLAPVACWGILAYMAYQQAAFGDAFAFVKTQRNWAVRRDVPFGQHLQSLATLEPIWSKYDPTSVAYWARYELDPHPLFSLDFVNPICVVSTAGAVAFGAWRKWLNAEETLLAAVLLLIPYLTHSFQTVMMAQGRYAASVFPFYLVLGQLLWRAPPPLSAAVLAIFAFLLGAYSALFAAWYRFI